MNRNVLTQSDHHISTPHQTGHKPLTSPKTNLEITDPALAMIFPNVLARGMVLEYREERAREWAAAERRWREAHGMGPDEGVEEEKKTG